MRRWAWLVAGGLLVAGCDFQRAYDDYCVRHSGDCAGSSDAGASADAGADGPECALGAIAVLAFGLNLNDQGSRSAGAVGVDAARMAPSIAGR